MTATRRMINRRLRSSRKNDPVGTNLILSKFSTIGSRRPVPVIALVLCQKATMKAALDSGPLHGPVSRPSTPATTWAKVIAQPGLPPHAPEVAWNGREHCRQVFARLRLPHDNLDKTSANDDLSSWLNIPLLRGAAWAFASLNPLSELAFTNTPLSADLERRKFLALDHSFECAGRYLKKLGRVAEGQQSNVF